jgi:hypothetical protein
VVTQEQSSIDTLFLIQTPMNKRVALSSSLGGSALSLF